MQRVVVAPAWNKVENLPLLASRMLAQDSRIEISLAIAAARGGS